LPSDKRIPSNYKGVHLIVFVHGFQGNSQDMSLLKNNVALLYPQGLYLSSCRNEDSTEGDIEHMGANLADEVRCYIQDFCSCHGQLPLGRLSFVAHSIGGLIVRSALPRLSDFRDKMYTILTFSSAHLGYMYAQEYIKGGLWLLNRLRQSKCVQQLSLTDDDDPNETFIGRLSRTPGLEHFTHVVLVSCYQDTYAPFASARIEISKAAANDEKLGPVYIGMARSILKPVDPKRVVRFDVDFHIPDTNVDTVIGRHAHIQFLECQPLMKMLTHKYGFLFE